MVQDLTPARFGHWRALSLGIGALLLLALLALIWLTPVKDGAKDWTAQMRNGGWMAWTFPVAFFFWCIACLLVAFTLLAIRFPPIERLGLLRIETTRGDRLFISLLGSAFICLAYLFFAGPPVWAALAICLVYAVAVFRWV